MLSQKKLQHLLLCQLPQHQHMPPKKSLTRKRGHHARSAQATDEDPPARRSGRTSTCNATLASQSVGEPQPLLEVAPPPTVDSNPSVPPTQELMESIVTAVTTEVSKQLAARQNQDTVQHPLPSQLSDNYTTSVVNSAINAAHSRITGVAQLLPVSNVANSVVPTQVFLSSSLPIDLRVSAKLTGKVYVRHLKCLARQ